MSLDATEIDRLVVDLTKAERVVQVEAVAIVTHGALNIRNDARRFASGIAHAPQYPQSITYDIHRGVNGDVSADIGPDKGKPQGALGNILEYGTSKNAPLAHLGPALDIEGPRFEQAFTDVADKTLR